MSPETIRTVYSADRRNRVCIFRRDDGTFGFCEERFSEAPLERCWIPTCRHTESICSSEETVLRESIGRVPWLAEMVARDEDIDGLPRGKVVGPPPRLLDGAAVVCFTPIDQRHRHTGNCRQIRDGAVQGPASGLAICQYPNETGYFLFGCDANWKVISDTCHQTLEDAKDQAEFEYSGVSSTWQETA